MAGAEYFLSHDNDKEAVNELTQVLQANPNSTEAMELLGSVMIGGFNFDQADRIIAEIRRVDRDSLRADLLGVRP